MSDTMIPADMAGVMDGNGRGNGWADGLGGDGVLVLIVLFLLVGRGGWGNNGNGNPVTEAGLCNAMNFNNLESAVGRLNDNQTAIAMQEQRDLCTGFAAVNAGISQNRFDSQKCCCETQRAIDGVNYNSAMNTASINENTTAQVQRVLDKIYEMEDARKDARIQQLELNAALCGVVRYPQTVTYGAGISPFFGGCCQPTGCCGTSF